MLLACGQAPYGALRCARLGVPLIPNIRGAQVFPVRAMNTKLPLVRFSQHPRPLCRHGCMWVLAGPHARQGTSF